MLRILIPVLLLCGAASAQEASVAKTRLKKMIGRIYQDKSIESWRFSFDASGFSQDARAQLKLGPQTRFLVLWRRDAAVAGGLALRATGVEPAQRANLERQMLPFAKFALMPRYLASERTSLLNQHLSRPYKAVVQGADLLVFTPQFRANMTRSEIRFDVETEQIRQVKIITGRGDLTLDLAWQAHGDHWLLRRMQQASPGRSVDVTFRYQAVGARMVVSRVEATAKSGETRNLFSLSLADHALGIAGAGMDTPRAVFAKATRAIAARSYMTFARCLTPESQDHMNLGLIAVSGFATMDRSRKPDPAKRKELERIFLRYKLTPLLNGNQDRTALQKAVEAVTRKAALLDELVRFAARHGRSGNPLQQASLGELQDDVKIEGLTASASVTRTRGGKPHSAPIRFRKIDGAWRIAITQR